LTLLTVRRMARPKRAAQLSGLGDGPSHTPLTRVCAAVRAVAAMLMSCSDVSSTTAIAIDGKIAPVVIALVSPRHPHGQCVAAEHRLVVAQPTGQARMRSRRSRPLDAAGHPTAR
jgi:hypothetical protein